MSQSALEIMEKAAETYRVRNKQYGDNYKTFGRVMVALLPEGLTLRTEDDFNRYGVIIQIVSKLTRYFAHPMAGHADTIHDLGVYSFMLEELDLAIAEEKERQAHCEHVWGKQVQGMVGCTNCPAIKDYYAGKERIG